MKTIVKIMCIDSSTEEELETTFERVFEDKDGDLNEDKANLEAIDLYHQLVDVARDILEEED